MLGGRQPQGGTVGEHVGGVGQQRSEPDHQPAAASTPAKASVSSRATSSVPF